jgi:hypothetical protein
MNHLRILIAFIALALATSFFGLACDSGVTPVIETPQPTAPHAKETAEEHAAHAGHSATEGAKSDMHSGRKVVLPEGVAGKWSGVKLALLEKASGKSTELNVKLEKPTEIPGSGLTVKVSHFLPGFMMNADQITSVSNEPKNPAAKITIIEAGKEIYTGWIFAKMPGVHPFAHEKWGLTLIEGLPSAV